MEEKTTRRLVVWIGAAVAVVLCVVAGVLLMPRQPIEAGERVAEPSLPPALATPAPTASAKPTATPEPTVYVLPLVPRKATPSPSPSVSPPEQDARGPSVSGLGGRYDGTCKDLLAVGVQNGAATAILLVRISDAAMTVVSIPCETEGAVYTLDAEGGIAAVNSAPLSSALRRGGRGERQRLWNLVWAVKNTVGVEAAHFVALELDCLVELVAALDGLTGQNGAVTPERAGEILASSGNARAAGMAEVGVGLVNAMRETALWELPALQKLTRDKLISGLTVRQMILLALSFGKIKDISCYILPTETDGRHTVLSYAAAEKILKKLYQ